MLDGNGVVIVTRLVAEVVLNIFATTEIEYTLHSRIVLSIIDLSLDLYIN